MLTALFLTILTAPPALPVTLGLEPVADAPSGLVYRVTNTGDTPVRVVGHRGLLSLEVKVPGRRAAVKCAPPPGARPGVVDPERVHRLGAGASIAETVDLRWFCWTTRATKALATPGATVLARYGFRRASARTWVASSPDGATRVGRLESEPIAAPAPPAAVVPAGSAPVLTLRPLPARVVTGSGRSIPVVLRLDNASPDDVRVFVRPDLFRFDVHGPVETVRCALVRAERAPMRESFTRLAPRRRTTLFLDLAAVCPSDTFAAPGIYDVEPVFDAVYDGASVGLRAVTGTFPGSPLVVRVGAGDLDTYEAQEPDR